jgi:hypothetical protein
LSTNTAVSDLPEKHRRFAQETVDALRSIRLGSDGLPVDPAQGPEAHLAYHQANGLRARLGKCYGPVAGALRTVCTTYLDMVNAHRDGKRHAEWGPRWLAALAMIPDLLPAAPVADVTITDEREEPLNSPRVQKMIADDPDLLGFIGQALAEDVDSEG